MGRKCAVPHCYTGYRKCKEKASLYRVPDDDFFLSKWQEAIARDDRPITPKDYVCEKHFKDDDILRRRIIKDVIEEYQRPRLKPDAIPSIFPDLPEFILKMVKKRRKITVENKDTDASKSDDNNESEHNAIEEVKLEPIDMIEDDATVSNSRNERMLNNEIDIKSEPEETTMDSLENEDNEKDDPNFGPKMHHCDECDYKTQYSHNLRTHKTKHLTGEGAYLHCEHCPNYKTKWELTFRNHLKIKHGIGKQEVFRCTLCQYVTKVKLCLKRHYDRHNRGIFDKKLSCTFPGCVFADESKTLLDMHIRSHNEVVGEQPKSFKCTECLYETNSKTHIIKHIKSAHNTGDDTVVSVYAKQDSPLLIPTGFREIESNENISKHVFKDNYQKPNELKAKIWKCPKCPYATFFQHALKKHRQTECEKDIYFCVDCNFKSCYKPDYIKHTLIHRNVTVESVSRDRIVFGETERLCVEPDIHGSDVLQETEDFQNVQCLEESREGQIEDFSEQMELKREEEGSGSNTACEFVLIKDENHKVDLE